MIRRRGFTLIESIVVLAIMSVIALMASQLFLTAQQQNQLISVQSDFLTDSGAGISQLREEIRNISVTSCSLGLNVNNGTGQTYAATGSLPAQVTRGLQLSFRKIISFPYNTNGTSQPVVDANVTCYTFQPATNASGAEASLIKSLPPGIQAWELVRSYGNLTLPVTPTVRDPRLLRLIQACPAGTTPGVTTANIIFPYFEKDNSTGTPKLNVCFKLFQGVHGTPQTGSNSLVFWSWFVKPVFISNTLQP